MLVPVQVLVDASRPDTALEIAVDEARSTFPAYTFPATLRSPPMALPPSTESADSELLVMASEPDKTLVLIAPKFAELSVVFTKLLMVYCSIQWADILLLGFERGGGRGGVGPLRGYNVATIAEVGQLQHFCEFFILH